MANALVKDERKSIALNAIDPFASAGEDLGGSNAAYLKFNGNSGEYTFGAEQEELPHGTLLAVDMMSFRRGWICWKDSNVVDEQMVRVIDGPPLQKSELPDHGPYVVTAERKDGWSEQAAINLKMVDGSGREFTFKVTSVSALRAIGTLSKDFSKEYKQHPGEVAVVKLGASSFMPKNKQWGKKHSPLLPITEWRNEVELLAEVGDNPADYADEADAGEAEAAAPATSSAPAETVKPVSTAPAAATGAPRRRGF